MVNQTGGIFLSMSSWQNIGYGEGRSIAAYVEKHICYGLNLESRVIERDRYIVWNSGNF